MHTTKNDLNSSQLYTKTVPFTLQNGCHENGRPDTLCVGSQAEQVPENRGSGSVLWPEKGWFKPQYLHIHITGLLAFKSPGGQSLPPPPLSTHTRFFVKGLSLSPSLSVATLLSLLLASIPPRSLRAKFSSRRGRKMSIKYLIRKIDKGLRYNFYFESESIFRETKEL